MAVTNLVFFRKEHQTSVIVTGLLALLCTSTAYAQISGETSPQINEMSSAPAVQPSAGFGGFFTKLGSSINQVVTGSRDKKQILDLAPGTYQKSNEAIGQQIDIDECRITRGVLSVPSFTNYANQVLEKLKLASTIEQVPGQVIVVANDQMDAGSTADGNVFVSSGYIRELKNEDQLASLLAHELSHVLLRHHDSNAFSRVQKQFATLAGMGMGIRNAIDKSTGGAASNALSPGQKKILQQIEFSISITDIALSPAWGRRQEAEADRLAMDLLLKAGYSYQDGLLPWLEAVARWDAEQAKRKAESFQKQQLSLQELVSHGQFDDSLKQSLNFAFNDIKGQLSASHEGGDKRLTDIDGYYITVYSERVPQVSPTVKAFEQIKNRPDVKVVLEAYSKAFQARAYVSDQNYAASLETLKPLLAANSQIAGHAIPNQLMFETLRGLGRRKEAEAYLTRSLHSDNTVWAAFDSAATYFKDLGKADVIAKVGQDAFQRFSGAPSAYPRLIALYKRNGLTQNMQSTLAECTLKQADKRDQCIAASQ